MHWTWGHWGPWDHATFARRTHKRRGFVSIPPSLTFDNGSWFPSFKPIQITAKLFTMNRQNWVINSMGHCLIKIIDFTPNYKNSLNCSWRIFFWILNLKFFVKSWGHSFGPVCKLNFWFFFSFFVIQKFEENYFSKIWLFGKVNI